jgi:hypothetical protein
MSPLMPRPSFDAMFNSRTSRGVPVEPEIRFHGTYRACLMGEAPPGPYGFLWTCRNHECRLCKIMGNSLCLPADGTLPGRKLEA